MLSDLSFSFGKKLSRLRKLCVHSAQASITEATNSKTTNSKNLQAEITDYISLYVG